ncbi:hypothetical protein acdb102_11620 [Acidothermaceae bacterium B102]|nr:hypothetical protein acdb102_11620 [Acidothermaceae bacterium B102]
MIAAVEAATALALAILLAGNDSRSRLATLLHPSARSRAGSPSPFWHWRARPGRSRRAAVAASVEVPFGLALELRSGRDLAGALRAVGDELAGGEVSDRLHRAAAAAAHGGDVGPILTAGATSFPAATGDLDALGVALRATAACCDASTSAGLPLAEVLDAVAHSARSHAVLVGRAKAELAGASTTSVVLGCLPLAGLAMGQLLGARPGHVLLGTAWGLACLGLAMLLTAVGVGWFRLIGRGLRKAIP